MSDSGSRPPGPEQTPTNPYQARAVSAGEAARLADADRRLSGDAAVRSAIRLSVVSGLLMLAYIAVLPHLLRWQLTNVLTPYGAEKYVDWSVSQSLSAATNGLLFNGGAAALAIVAGVLMRYRPAPGSFLLMVVSAAVVIDAVLVLLFADGANFFTGTVRGIWWSVLLRSAHRANRLAASTQA